MYCFLLVKHFHLTPILRGLKKKSNPPIRHFVMAAILDFEFFYGVLYSTSQALSFDTHIEGVEKKSVIGHIVTAAILDFKFFHGVLYSTSQALSFDTHIEGVEKKNIIRHFVTAAILKLEFFLWCTVFY